MTDEQVKKGLECCAEHKCGFDCPYIDKNFPGVFHCTDCKKDALALINRLEAENKQLRKETAKDILKTIAQFRAVSPKLSVTWYELAKKYGMEVD